MSILKCNTLLTIHNCTGLEIHLTIRPCDSETHMRVQPVGSANMCGAIESRAFNLVSWVTEWWHLVAYGPTHRQVEWTIAAATDESARFNMNGPFQIEIKWSDPSVSWSDITPGIWTLDISQTNAVQLYIRGDLGQYVQKRNSHHKPSTIQSVQLKFDLEIACEDDLTFGRIQIPIANMFWRKDINLDNIVNPKPAPSDVRT
jgi:hypothetical protein